MANDDFNPDGYKAYQAFRESIAGQIEAWVRAMPDPELQMGLGGFAGGEEVSPLSLADAVRNGTQLGNQVLTSWITLAMNREKERALASLAGLTEER